MKTILILGSIALLLAACGKTGTVDDASPEASAPTPYPLDVCLVSGEELGSMGDPVVIVHEGREIKFCCEHCVPKFEKDPEKYLAKLDRESGGAAPADPSGHGR